MRVLVGERADGKLEFAFGNLPGDASRVRAVRRWTSRRPVEQGHQLRREELGLDHFEGRSRRGFHPRLVTTPLAYGFLLLGRPRLVVDRKKTTRPVRGGKGGAEPTRTLPGVRRASQSLLRPCPLPGTARAPDPDVTESD
jgi:hypothetical protein